MNARKIYTFLGVGLFLGGCAFLFSKFLAYHQEKTDLSGLEFYDAVMEFFPAVDCSFYIFSITYGSILLYAILEFRKPMFVQRLMLSYGILLLMRMITLTIVPLKEPESLLYLDDPFLNNLIYPGEIGADLFFSGHAGLLFLLFFITRKWIFIALGVILSVLLMMQRVHYSIDVIAAFPFAYVIAKITNYLIPKLSFKE